MAHDIFISYASRDKVVADAVCATLESRKIRCWIAPRDVLAGQPYAESILDGISRSRVFVLVFSSDSNISQQVLREVERAVSKGIPILPFRIEDVEPTKSMELFLSATHWLDALTPPLERHLQRLADTVEMLLTSETEMPPKAESAPPPPESAIEVEKHRKRRRPIYMLIASVAIVIVAVIAVYLTGGFGGGDKEKTTGLLPDPTPSTASTATPTSTPAAEEVLYPPTKDKIIIGVARPFSGELSFLEEYAFGPIYKMWVEEVNARGGIYVEEYSKKLPIELKVYDDTSDLGTMMTLLERLMVEDKVDFVLSPAGTDFINAAAPIFNKYEYILMGMEGGSASTRELIPGLPYFFNVLNFSDHNQVPVLADLLEKCGVKTVAIIFVDDVYGIDYSRAAIPELARKGIDVISVKSVPPGINDLSAILQEAKAAEVDAFLSFTYPDTCILATTQSMEIGFNPDVFLLGPGGNFAFYKDLFGADVVEGVMAWGAWNEKSSPAAAAFHDKFLARYDEGIFDYWGQLTYWSALQFFEQAIEKAGTLDQAVIRDIMATETFDTCLGPTWFDGGLLAVECYPGQVGQWQNGQFEVIDPGKKRTAEPIYPKPEWPGGTPSAGLLYEDDFSNPVGGWSQESVKDYDKIYNDGEYHISVKKLSCAVWVWNHWQGPFDDFSLEIDARLVGEPAGGAYGLIFRLQDINTYSRFIVWEDGYYLVGTDTKGVWTELQGKTKSAFINQGNSTNHLKVVCQGNNIEVYVNGHHLTTVTDDSFTGGYVGMIVESSESGADVAFDNLKVYRLD